MRRWGCWSVLRFTSVVIHALFGPCLVKPLQFQQCDSKTCSSYIKHLSTDKHYTWYWYLEETCSAFLNVKVCPWVIRLTSDPPLQYFYPTVPHIHQAPSLFEQGMAVFPAVVSPRPITEVYNWVSRAGGQQWVTNWVTHRVYVSVWVTQIVFALSHSQIALELKC